MVQYSTFYLGETTELAIGTQPTVSPSGKRMAYVNNADIWVMNINGTGTKQHHQPRGKRPLTHLVARWFEDRLRHPALGGKGRGHHEPGRQQPGAHRGKQDGEYPLWNGTELSWSPKSDRLAYSYNNQIRVMNLDGYRRRLGGARVLGPARGIWPDVRNPKWGPEGTSIVFEGCMPGCGVPSIGGGTTPYSQYLRSQCGWNELARDLRPLGRC